MIDGHPHWVVFRRKTHKWIINTPVTAFVYDYKKTQLFPLLIQSDSRTVELQVL